MRLTETRRARRPIGLTPLIDVVFLLLVFFMLASTFLKFSTVRIETAGGGAGTTDLTKIVLVHVGPGPKILINGTPAETTGMIAQLNALKKQGRDEVILVMRKAATVDDMVTALSQARQSEFERVRIVR